MITSVEGASTGLVLLATFTDPGGAEAVGDYGADIDWGDGTGNQVLSGAIQSPSGNNFGDYGTHTYAEESAIDHPGSQPYQITIQLHHETSVDPAAVTSTATVSTVALHDALPS